MFKFLRRSKNPLDGLSEEKAELAEQAFRAGVIQMRDLAVQNCPVDTGALRSSVASFPIDTGEEGKYQLGSNMEYAVYVHDGTSKEPAQPFIQYSIDQLEDAVARMVMEAIK